MITPRSVMSEVVLDPLGDGSYNIKSRHVGRDNIMTREDTTIEALQLAGVSITQLSINPSMLMSPTNPLDIEERAGAALSDYINNLNEQHTKS